MRVYGFAGYPTFGMGMKRVVEGLGHAFAFNVWNTEISPEMASRFLDMGHYDAALLGPIIRGQAQNPHLSAKVSLDDIAKYIVPALQERKIPLVVSCMLSSLNDFSMENQSWAKIVRAKGGIIAWPLVPAHLKRVFDKVSKGKV